PDISKRGQQHGAGQQERPGKVIGNYQQGIDPCRWMKRARLPPPRCASRCDAVHSLPSLAIPDAFGSPQNKRAADRSAAPLVYRELTYFRLVIAVRSAENFTIPVAPHQLDPIPPGLMGVMK